MSHRGKRVSAGDKALQMVRQQSKVDRGFKSNPPDLPKPYVESPWNSWTFGSVATATASTALTIDVTMDTILSSLASKVNLSSIERVKMKIQSAQVWVTPATTLLIPNCQVEFYELSKADNQLRNTQSDTGNWNKPAKAGYVYPLVDQTEIYNLTDKDRKVLSVISATADSVVTIRVQLLWRSLPA